MGYHIIFKQLDYFWVQ